MKKVTLKLTALVMLLGGAITVSNAQSTNKIRVVTSAVPFLRITPDARSGGMGDIGIATSPDANANFVNLAKTPFNSNKVGISVNYVPWLRDLSVNDVYMLTLAGFFKIDDKQAISASFRYFSLGNIQFTDQLGNTLQTFKPKEFAFDLGYSRKLSKKNGIALALRFIRSSLASGTFSTGTYKAGTSIAGDLHFFHHGAKENGQGFNYGITLSNLGSKISYSSNANDKDYIPANFGLGLAYTKVFNTSNKITFGLDFNKLMVPTAKLDSAGNFPSQAALARYRSKSVVSSWFSSWGDATDGVAEEIQEVSLGIGAEYWYNDLFAFRAGYFYENKNKGNRRYFTVGAGLKYSKFGINFAYLFPSGSGVSRNPLSNTWRFGLIFDMAGKK